MFLKGRELQSILQSSTASRGESHHGNLRRKSAQILLQAGVMERQKPSICCGEMVGRQEGSRNKPSPEG